MKNMLGLFRCGLYNEVALILSWPLSEVSLYNQTQILYKVMFIQQIMKEHMLDMLN